MKALVVSNCATSAYTNTTKTTFPDWEVRGAMIDLAEKWVSSEPNEKFIQYAKDCNIYIGYPLEGYDFAKLISEKCQKVIIPAFAFRGLHPDCFHLTGIDSVLGGGNLHSRIVVGAFQAGHDPTTTAMLFKRETYETFGYFTCFGPARTDLVSRFGKYGIDLTGALERWVEHGNFLYSYNHPRIDVLIEILRRALIAADLLPVSALDCDNVGIVDELAESVVWPVYPGIAESFHLDGSLRWRKGKSHAYQSLSLGQFIDATFSALAGKKLPPIKDMEIWLRNISDMIRRNNRQLAHNKPKAPSGFGFGDIDDYSSILPTASTAVIEIQNDRIASQTKKLVGASHLQTQVINHGIAQMQAQNRQHRMKVSERIKRMFGAK